MLQRVRDALHDIDTRSAEEEEQRLPARKVNLIHRLDRGASGCLLLTYADDADDDVVSSFDDDSRLVVDRGKQRLVHGCRCCNGDGIKAGR